MLMASATRENEIMIEATNVRYPSISKRIIVIVGGFGSGKTEVSVNLGRFLALSGRHPIAIADFDLVNPYFRSREATAEMAALGIRVIAPKGGQFYADLPILLPEIKGMIEMAGGLLILDVGGDAQGARALGSLSVYFPAGDYEMLMVLNSRRPLTSDVAGCLKTMRRIEATAKLKFTGLISNSHLIDETDADILLEGYRLALEVSRASNLPIFFVSAKSNILQKMDTKIFDCPVLPLTRSMLKPWERKAEQTNDKSEK